MKALIIVLWFTGVLVYSQAQSDGGLTGNECYGQADGALIPYPGDCTKFLVCQWYNGTVTDCPSGLYFNPILSVCDWPTSAGCTQGSISPTPPPITVPTTTTPRPTPTTTPTSTPAPTPSPETIPTPQPVEVVCKNQPDGALFPYPWNCAYFIRCECNTYHIFPCGNGRAFNPVLLICDYPENAGCVATPYPMIQKMVDV